MLHHHSPMGVGEHHLLYAVSPCSSHSPTGTERLMGGYESADESSCEGFDEELDFIRSFRCYRSYHNDRDSTSSSPPTPPVTRQRSHTYCGPEIPRLPFLTTTYVDRCHSNDALWQRRRTSSSMMSHENRRLSPNFSSNSGEIYETRSSISSSSSTSTSTRRKFLSRCLQEDDEDIKGCTGLRRALSSLSLRILQGEKERPVQKILRAPRRRQTIRGLSGLPIESVNQWNSAATMSG